MNKSISEMVEFLSNAVEFANFKSINGRVPEWREGGKQGFPLKCWANDTRKAYGNGSLDPVKVGVLASLDLTQDVLVRKFGRPSAK